MAGELVGLFKKEISPQTRELASRLRDKKAIDSMLGQS